MMKRTVDPGIPFAVGAAALYALSVPFGKLLLASLSPAMMAGLLYLGAGLGMSVLRIFTRKSRETREIPLSKRDIPFAVGMILLDVFAPILLMLGLRTATPETVSLLNNFEIVATAAFAFFLFGERIPPKLRIGIVLILAASILLSWERPGTVAFSSGSVLVLLATVCWGLENNLTRKMSAKDPTQIVALKGWFSGFGSLGVAVATGTFVWNPGFALLAMLLGCVAYGLSIFLYVNAQRRLGAAKTSTFYAIAPFFGAGLSFLLFPAVPQWTFYPALAAMAAGAWFSSRPNPTRSTTEVSDEQRMDPNQ